MIVTSQQQSKLFELPQQDPDAASGADPCPAENETCWFDGSADEGQPARGRRRVGPGWSGRPPGGQGVRQGRGPIDSPLLRSGTTATCLQESVLSKAANTCMVYVFGAPES